MPPSPIWADNVPCLTMGGKLYIKLSSNLLTKVKPGILSTVLAVVCSVILRKILAVLLKYAELTAHINQPTFAQRFDAL
jgi:hypothetical protein